MTEVSLTQGNSDAEEIWVPLMEGLPGSPGGGGWSLRELHGPGAQTSMFYLLLKLPSMSSDSEEKHTFSPMQ